MKRLPAMDARGYAGNNEHINGGGTRSPSTHHEPLRASMMDRLSFQETYTILNDD